jgi:hypothetical protein
VTDQIKSLERMNNTREGNPRWRVTLVNGGVHTTKPDAAVGHVIENSEYREGPVEVTFNANGEIIGVEVKK